ncbi:MAG: hypothetical protein Tsb0013_22420 [Phycisphaerales bacterium]
MPLLIVVMVLGGCASPWATHYRPVRQLSDTTFTPRDSARIIEVEWERLATYEREARRRAVERDERADQLAPDVARRELQSLLDTLRVDADPANVLVLGSARFTSTDLLDPFSEDVRTLTARRGGDIAVVCVEPLGVRETVEYATRTEWYDRDVYRGRGDDRRGRVEWRVEERIPVVVPRETWGYTLIVLRVERADTVRALTGGRHWLP